MYLEIERLCNEKGIKVGRMCADIGIRKGMMSDLKHGRTALLSAKSIWKIAQYFGVSTDSICATADQIAGSE